MTIEEKRKNLESLIEIRMTMINNAKRRLQEVCIKAGIFDVPFNMNVNIVPAMVEKSTDDIEIQLAAYKALNDYRMSAKALNELEDEYSATFYEVEYEDSSCL